MTTLAVAILMLATAMSTASALLQVLSSPTQRLPYIDNSPLSGSSGRKWLFIGAIVLIAAGSFVYSQQLDSNALVDFGVFLIVGVAPVVLIRFMHNRKVPESK